VRILFLDAPDHTRLRSLVNKAFTPRAVERLAPRIREIIDERLDGVAGQKGFDLIEALAGPLLSLAAANRDPDACPEPDRFDITRPDVRHHSFGGGASGTDSKKSPPVHVQRLVIPSARRRCCAAPTTAG
jgi:cytochrome P450